MSLKIAQLSDCHLAGRRDAAYRGQNAEENLERVWKAARAWGPDLVLLTGDLSEDASTASYQRLHDIVQADVPVLALPGNHDEPGAMRQYFPRGPWQGPLLWAQAGWGIVMLDSTVPGKVGGRLESAALEALEDACSRCPADHLLVALHHQPIPVDAPWIDKYALEEPGPFLEAIGRESRVRCVIWGHIHHHFAAERGGVLMLGAPSTAANSLPRTDRFRPDPAGPGCRTLELDAGGAVTYGQILVGET